MYININYSSCNASVHSECCLTIVTNIVGYKNILVHDVRSGW